MTEPAAPIPPSVPCSPRPLVVDIDHSLLCSDLFDETLVDGLRRQPVQTMLALRSLRQGRAALKAQLAVASRLDVRTLPYNRDVLACLADARSQGRPVHLVSAADASLVQAIADHLGGFAGHHGSSAELNLKGEQKAQWLAQRFGARGFDYVGDARSDLRVWAQAAQIITVGQGFVSDGEEVRAQDAADLDLPQDIAPETVGVGDEVEAADGTEPVVAGGSE